MCMKIIMSYSENSLISIIDSAFLSREDIRVISVECQQHKNVYMWVNPMIKPSQRAGLADGCVPPSHMCRGSVRAHASIGLFGYGT